MPKNLFFENLINEQYKLFNENDELNDILLNFNFEKILDDENFIKSFDPKIESELLKIKKENNGIGIIKGNKLEPDLEMFIFNDGRFNLRFNYSKEQALFYNNKFYFLNQNCSSSSILKKLIKEHTNFVFIKQTVVDHEKTIHTFLLREELFQVIIEETHNSFYLEYKDIENNIVKEFHHDIQCLVESIKNNIIYIRELNNDF